MASLTSALKLAPLSVDIRGNNSNFKSAMTETKRLGSATSKSVENDFKRSTGTTNKLFGGMGSVITGVGKTVSSFGTGITKLGQGAQKVGANLTSHITKPILGIGTALAGVALFKGFSRLTNIDTAKAKLSALGNTTKDVEKIMESANKAVKGTAFGLDEAATTAANAVAAGIEPGKELTKYLTMTGDAAAIAGSSMSEMGSIINKVQTGQVAYTDDLNQLADRGLPIYQWLGEEAGVAADQVKELASEGSISSEMLFNAIQNNIGGAAKVMGEKSFTATIQNIGASIGRIGANFLDGGNKGEGFFSKIKPMLVEMLGRMDVLEVKANELGQAFGQAFTGFIEKLSGVKKWYDELSKGQQQLLLKVVAFGGGALVALGPVLTIVGKILVPFGKLFNIIGGGIKIFGGLFTALSTLSAPALIVGGAVAGIGIALVAAAGKGKSFKDIFSGIFNTVKGGIQWFIKLGGAIKNVFTGDIGGQRNGMDQLKNLFGEETGRKIYDGLQNIKQTIKDAWADISGFFADQAAGLLSFWDQYGGQFIQALQNFWAIISPIVKVAMGLILSLVKSAWGSIKGVIDGGLTVIKGLIKVFTGIFTLDFKTMWSGVKDIFSGAIKFIWNYINLMFIGKVLKGVGGLASGAKGTIKGMWTGIKNFFTGGIGNVNKAVTGFSKSILSKFRILRTGGHSVMKSLWELIKNVFKNSIGKVLGFVKNFFTKTIGHFKDLRTSGHSVMKSLWEMIKGTFRKGISWVIDKMTGLPKSIGKGVKKGIHFVSDAFKALFTGAVKAVKGPVNAIIGGANWVLSKFGVKKEDRIAEWAPKYEKGTLGHPGGDAIVNDGRGAEMIFEPHKDPYIQKGRNIKKRNLKRGTQVASAEQTASIMGRARPTFHYSLGTFFDSAKNVAGKAWSGVKSFASAAKEKIGDIWDFMTEPGKLVDKVLSTFVDTDSLTSGFTRQAGKGLVSTTKKSFIEFIKSKFDEFGDDGDFNGSVASNGVYQYLVDIAKKVMKQFPGMRISSGYREGDPYYHGKRMAIDLAYGAGDNGNSKYFAPANWAFNKFKKSVAYVITQGKVKDRKGMSGQPADSQWHVWPDHDHYDHLHLNGALGPGYGGGGGAISGSGPKASGGHQNWMKLAGFKPNEYSAINWIVNRESGWNYRAVNSSSGAYGLPQSLPGSKMASAGSDWRTNPVTQLRWMRGYVKSRYGGANGALSFWKSHNWYENGGFVKHKTFFAGERGPESVIPLTKPARALEVIAQSLDWMGFNMPASVPFDGYNATLNRKVTTAYANGDQFSGNANDQNQLTELIGLMRELVLKEKDITIEADNRSIARGVWKYTEEFASNSKFRKQRNAKGVR